MIRLLLVEDQSLVRGALATLLSLEPDFEVVGEVARGDEVLSQVESLRPDIVLLDIELPGRNGLDVARELAEHGAPSRVMMLTTFGRPGYLRRAIAAGAAGFMLKDAPVDALAAGIRRIAEGGRVVDPGLAAEALKQGTSPLTERETDVLRVSAAGASIAEMALTLHLAEGTVRNHLSTAIQKLGARNRLEAVLQAERMGWL